MWHNPFSHASLSVILAPLHLEFPGRLRSLPCTMLWGTSAASACIPCSFSYWLQMGCTHAAIVAAHMQPLFWLHFLATGCTWLHWSSRELKMLAIRGWTIRSIKDSSFGSIFWPLAFFSHRLHVAALVLKGTQNVGHPGLDQPVDQGLSNFFSLWHFSCLLATDEACACHDRCLNGMSPRSITVLV